ncbi:hypothetical protein MATL_G00146470 [Megalops atlanticus]|uniref:Zinc finger protein 385B n=1 Tax=Megalops atlanticus TaxID=7932 RepID=A0A9D3T8F6_MEGAT|nr:hypothetical protein MATL_G00146470 [Megalops atlanticus]
MKRPLSPTQLLENGGVCPPFSAYADVEEPRNGLTDLQLHQQKKKLLFSLCEVCNIQLNSAAQAQVHYNGKSHLKRVKQLCSSDPAPACSPTAPSTSVSTGSSCHSSALPGLVRTPSLMMQSTLEMKPFMSFPVEATSPVGLFPNFNTMDPVQKAVINHTFGVSIPPKKKQVISCSICQLRFNSDSQAEAHYKGSKHAKKLKAQESSKNKQKSAPTKDSAKTISASAAVTACSSEQTEKTSVLPNGPKACSPPEAFLPAASAVSGLAKAAPEPASASPPGETAPPAPPAPAPHPAKRGLEAHNTGSKHKTMLEARNGAGPIKAYPRPGSKLKVQATVMKGSGLQNKTFHCEICDVHVNSEIQLKQHISSRRHKDRVAGKPLKPKYSPYSKQQRSSSALAAKLALQKELVKPLSPAFISGPFCPTTAPSMPLHPRPNTPLFQTAPLPPSFLRAAPGPLRPAAGSTILFTPY